VGDGCLIEAHDNPPLVTEGTGMRDIEMGLHDDTSLLLSRAIRQLMQMSSSLSLSATGIDQPVERQ
jgi:hypothetical protein